ncbi:sodium- and chloride-dependent GABA transporter 2-like [Amphiura filiformis]|uniref:sodium- and chloride-dependent GABA transporter 2-like n=1 Tax=Amphiura filiformis TaxID=82378 RepID=UPI003B2216F5
MGEGSMVSKQEQAKAEEAGQELAPGITRETWGNRMDFVISCIGYAVGLGNIWRFPYLCYKNGGGAFLIPYLLCLLFAGIPLFFLEVALGQFMSRGCIKSWQICPLFQGVGYATALICLWCNLYYIVVLAWSLFYFFCSFTTNLPWAHCGNYWNTDTCTEDFKSVLTGAVKNCTDMLNSTSITYDLTDNGTIVEVQLNNCTNISYVPTSPVTEFWERRVLQISDSLEETGIVVWPLALTLLLGWVLVYFIIFKGVRTSGKIAYFTALFPYVVLTILLIRGVTLPGASKGLIYYLKPDLSRLTDGRVWIDAGSQICYSYAIGFGTLVALGSYNKFNQDCFKDMLAVVFANSFTSFYGGLAIFSVLGFMATQQGVEVGDVADKGPGLVFIAYPTAVTMMPISPLWACVFFTMILFVGLDSQFVAVEGWITAVLDFLPPVLRRGHNRELFTLAVCVVSYLFGLVFVTNGGMYVFQLFDYYSASGAALFFMAFFESFVIAWIYGGDRFYDDITFMIGYTPWRFFKWCWMYVTPLIVMAIWIFSCITYTPLTYGNYEYSAFGQTIGWFLALSSVFCVPTTMIYLIAKEKGSFRQRITQLIQPRLQPHQLRPKTMEDANGDHWMKDKGYEMTPGEKV